MRAIANEELEQIELKYAKKIDWHLFSEIVAHVKSNPLGNKTRLNADGYPEPLIMDYDLRNQAIIFLQPFFKVIHQMLVLEIRSKCFIMKRVTFLASA